MAVITLWHNPRCSKSRTALAVLEDAGADIVIRRYLDDPPGVEEIADIRRLMGNPPVIEMMRTGEKTFRELGLSKDSAEADLIAAMATHPILIERPVAIAADRATIGRPPERVRDLL